MFALMPHRRLEKCKSEFPFCINRKSSLVSLCKRIPLMAACENESLYCGSPMSSNHCNTQAVFKYFALDKYLSSANNLFWSLSH